MKVRLLMIFCLLVAFGLTSTVSSASKPKKAKVTVRRVVHRASASTQKALPMKTAADLSAMARARGHYAGPPVVVSPNAKLVKIPKGTTGLIMGFSTLGFYTGPILQDEWVWLRIDKVTDTAYYMFIEKWVVCDNPGGPWVKPIPCKTQPASQPQPQPPPEEVGMVQASSSETGYANTGRVEVPSSYWVDQGTWQAAIDFGWFQCCNEVTPPVTCEQAGQVPPHRPQ